MVGCGIRLVKVPLRQAAAGDAHPRRIILFKSLSEANKKATPKGGRSKMDFP